MKKLIIILSVSLLFFFSGSAQQNEVTKSQKVILITLDGLRWQELFTGADEKLITNKEYVKDTTVLKEKFWKNTAIERRDALFPFVWNQVTKLGEIHGNRTIGSKVNLTNKMWFSYPGYNEILTGRADDATITSNDKINNPNVTILEEINNLKKYKGKVAAFTSWDVFPYIINEERSGVLVNAAFDSAKGNNLTSREIFLNTLQKEIPSPWESVRLDAFTHHYALEHIKKNKPNFVYIAYGETDDFAHDGHYDAYLNSAHTTDNMIKELWDYTQSDPFYKDNTTFIVTTDHGRGTEPLNTWRSHGSNIAGADQTWLIVFGAQSQKKGEISKEEQLFTNQIANRIKTILK